MYVMKKYNIEVRQVDEVTSSHIHMSSNTNNDGSLQEKYLGDGGRGKYIVMGPP